MKNHREIIARLAKMQVGPGDAGELVDLCRELLGERDGLRALVKRASTDSTVTTSDNPGCFYCDHEKHTKNCPARKALEVKP